MSQSFTLKSSHSANSPLIIHLKLKKGSPPGELLLNINREVEVFIDGSPKGRSPLPRLSLSAGSHQLELRLGERILHRELINIQEEQLNRLEIELEEKGTKIPPVQGGGKETGAGKSTGGGFKRETLGWVLMGLGGAVILGGGVTGFMATGTDSELNDCRQDPYCVQRDRELELADDVRSQSLTTDLLLGSGVAIAATGAVLTFLLGKDSPSVTWQPLKEGGLAVGRIEF